MSADRAAYLDSPALLKLAIREPESDALRRYRVSNRVLDSAGLLALPDLRSLDAIHLASAEQFGSDLGGFVTYDERLASAATSRGLPVVRP